MNEAILKKATLTGFISSCFIHAGVLAVIGAIAGGTIHGSGKILTVTLDNGIAYVRENAIRHPDSRGVTGGAPAKKGVRNPVAGRESGKVRPTGEETTKRVQKQLPPAGERVVKERPERETASDGAVPTVPGDLVTPAVPVQEARIASVRSQNDGSDVAKESVVSGGGNAGMSDAGPASPGKGGGIAAGKYAGDGNGYAGVASPGKGRGAGAGSGSGDGREVGGGVACVKTLHTRYVNEQFRYIRDRVMKNIHYPRIAKRMGWMGIVTVAFIISETGYLENIRIVKGSGYKVLDESAVKTIRDIQPFPKPPVKAEIVIPIEFRFG